MVELKHGLSATTQGQKAYWDSSPVPLCHRKGVAAQIDSLVSLKTPYLRLQRQFSAQKRTCAR